jgi:hypothetical protein
LLAAERDPAMSIFADVGRLYGLRSTLVHGGQIKQSDLKKDLARISTMPPGAVETRFGVAVWYAVDRMRDLLRRAILARLCLADGVQPLWPLSGDISVDAMLSDDAMRAIWRAAWRTRLSDLGVKDAADPPTSAVDFLTPVSQEIQARQRRMTEESPGGES